MSEIWRLSRKRSRDMDAEAVAYDRYRPRYPNDLFDDIVELGELKPGAKTIEIGAGTGIATGPLISRGLQVIAIEPGPAMSAIAAGSSAPTPASSSAVLRTGPKPRA